MLKVKTTEIFAIIILTLFIWFVGWLWNHFFGLSSVIHDFVVGFGLIASFAYIWTIIKELGE